MARASGAPGPALGETPAPARGAGRARAPSLAAFLALALLMAWPVAARAATITEIFLLLPPEQTRGLSAVSRRALLERIGQGQAGYTAPSQEGLWMEVHGENALTLFGTSQAPVTYKVFPMPRGWQLLSICRSRQTYGPANAGEQPHETFLDLALYLVSATNDLIPAAIADFLPEVGVWDFVTRDTVEDRQAVRDLEAINQIFPDCLTCHASTQDPLALDIFTVTSINGHSCALLMAQFKLLPLRWAGDHFSKPYDRAARPGTERARPAPPRGLYYHEPGK
ncbi:MAG: hypothetical protein LBP92_00395 [Deltaproteobacteria bacterium]|nr:hypothetical protein [Deltaproteobacteria bacterium]